MSEQYVIDLFVENVLCQIKEAITYEPISQIFRLNPPILINKGLSQTEWKYFEKNSKNLNIVGDILQPTSILGFNRKDKKYIVKCTNDKYFYITDDYLKQLNLFHNDKNGDFIQLSYEECMILLSSFRKTNTQGYPVYIDPENDLNFKPALDFIIKKSK